MIAENDEKINIDFKEERKWYALYTKSRNEKKVKKMLDEQNIENYLPLEKKLKQWSDRKKWLEEPLIRSYIFVKIYLHEMFKVLETPGVVTVIRFERTPEPIPENQINTIKKILSNDVDYELSTENFDLGQKVEITQGKLKGIKGELITFLNKFKVLIRIDSINQNLIVQINPSNLLKLENFD